MAQPTEPTPPAKRGRKPGSVNVPPEALDFTKPICVLLDVLPGGSRVFRAFTADTPAEARALCDAAASEITLGTGRHVARFPPQYGVSMPVAQAAEMPLSFT